jgi:hypothetical protein
MFVLGALWWLIALPVRLVLWVVGLALWVLFLPLRLALGLLGLIGGGRLLQAGIIAGIGYFFYRLINDPAPERELDAPEAEGR